MAAEFAMPQNNLPGTARGARLWVSVADVLREDFDGVEAAVTTTSTSAAALMTYRKDGTAVASSVSFLSRDNTFEVRAVPLRTAMTAAIVISRRSRPACRRWAPCAPRQPRAKSAGRQGFRRAGPPARRATVRRG